LLNKFLANDVISSAIFFLFSLSGFIVSGRVLKNDG
jgi:hypothetical protein